MQKSKVDPQPSTSGQESTSRQAAVSDEPSTSRHNVDTCAGTCIYEAGGTLSLSLIIEYYRTQNILIELKLK